MTCLGARRDWFVIRLVIAFGGARMMKSMLYGVSASDPITFTGVAVLLFAIAFFACWIPAPKASRFEPMIALRTECAADLDGDAGAAMPVGLLRSDGRLLRSQNVLLNFAGRSFG